MTNTTREQRLRADEPAFPIVGSCAENQFNGMSLLDYFAAHAREEDVRFHMEHYFNNWHDMRLLPNAGSGVQRNTREQARYQYAHAMLKARKEPGQ